MFLKTAKDGLNDWWRWLLGIVVVVMGIIVGQLPLTGIALALGNNAGMSRSEIADMADSMDLSPVGIGQNLSLVLALLAFIGGIAGLWVAMKYLHHRPFRSLISPFEKLDWQKILFAFGLWMALALVAEFIFYLIAPHNYTFDLQLGRFIGLLFVSLLVLPFQTSFEELFFRGYLMQGIGLIAPFRWIPWVITSVAFGALHFMNPEVSAFGFGITMAYYIGVGLFLGLITLMDDSLELALGVHAATNIFSALFVTFDDSAIPTAALFRTAEVNMPLTLVALILAAILFTFLAAKRYGWADWTKCFGRVDKPHLMDV